MAAEVSLTVLAGMPSLHTEVEAADSGVARSVRDDLAGLAAREAFLEG